MKLSDALSLIRDVPDFPKKGIVFKDLSPVFAHPEAFEALIESMAESVAAFKPQKLAVIEARGFIVGAPLAYRLKSGLVLIRKRGKLPGKTLNASYSLEYGSDQMEMLEDSIEKDERVVLIDDVLATGGTLAAARQLVIQAGGLVTGIQVVLELASLKGRDRLRPIEVRSVC